MPAPASTPPETSWPPVDACWALPPRRRPWPKRASAPTRRSICWNGKTGSAAATSVGGRWVKHQAHQEHQAGFLQMSASRPHRPLGVLGGLGVSKLPSFLEELSEHLAGPHFLQPADHLRRMVAGRLAVDARPVIDAAALRIIGAEIEPADAGEGNRRRAHRAGFQGDIEVALDQARLAQQAAGLADGEDFGVGGGVFQLLDRSEEHTSELQSQSN